MGRLYNKLLEQLKAAGEENERLEASLRRVVDAHHGNFRLKFHIVASSTWDASTFAIAQPTAGYLLLTRALRSRVRDQKSVDCVVDASCRTVR